MTLPVLSDETVARIAACVHEDYQAAQGVRGELMVEFKQHGVPEDRLVALLKAFGVSERAICDGFCDGEAAYQGGYTSLVTENVVADEDEEIEAFLASLVSGASL